MLISEKIWIQPNGFVFFKNWDAAG